MTVCHIIPRDALLELAADPALPGGSRVALRQTARIDRAARSVRNQTNRLNRILASAALDASPPLAGAPAISIYDCSQASTLPGILVADPASSTDPAVRRIFRGLGEALRFFRQEFGRNSIDNRGVSVIASVHAAGEVQALWTGSQLAFGDGEGQGLLDFTRSNDTLAHELTHGVTQHALGLNYSGEAGALHESISDVFGSMFRQWQANQTAGQGDWLIGSDVIGPALQARGFTCLRDLTDPDAANCFWPQIRHYDNYPTNRDPHKASGIANLAFQRAASTIGGRSWERAGAIWYEAVCAGRNSTLRMGAFADRTRAAAIRRHGAASPEAAAVQQGWASVGL